MTVTDSTAPVGTRAREAAKLVAERVLWGRVAAQLAFERSRGTTRPDPVLVPSTAVLSTADQWRAATAEVRRLRLPAHHDRPKNWDALGAVGAVLRHCGRDATVLDAGSARYSSVLPWLRLYGLTDLLGTNLEFDRETRFGPVVFRHGDATATGLPGASLDALTCMSVVEHGVDVDAFLAEAARVLRPGGVLCLSTDYDAEPPDTTGRSAYGVPVRIFGPDDVRGWVARARELGLELDGDLALEHAERPVHWKRQDLRYTFILLTFVRRGPAG